MLFYRERPQRPVTACDTEEVSHVREVHETQSHKSKRRGMQQQKEKQQRIICGKNSESATRIETPVKVRVALRVQQNAGNQKAGEHEKKIHPNPTGLSCGQKKPSQRAEVETSVLPRESVQEEHAENRNAAKGIQFRHDRAD